MNTDQPKPEEIAKVLIETCYSEANRIANHCSDGAAQRAMKCLYDAANKAKQDLSDWTRREPENRELREALENSRYRLEFILESILDNDQKNAVIRLFDGVIALAQQPEEKPGQSDSVAAREGEGEQ